MSRLGTLKSQRALAVRHHGADSPQAREAKEKLDAEKMTAHVERLVANAPLLTDEQRCRLAELLRPVRIASGGGDHAVA